MNLRKRAPRAHARGYLKRRRRILVGGGVALLGLVAILFAPFLLPTVTSYLDADRRALRSELSQPSLTELRLIYSDRHFKPIWLERGVPSVEGRQVLERIADSRADNLIPETYGVAALQDVLGRKVRLAAKDRARFEVQLSRAYGSFVSDLRLPLTGADYLYTDPSLSPSRPSATKAIRDLAAAPHTRRAIVEATRMNQFYMQYRNALTSVLKAKPTDTVLAQRLRINLERVRALPPYLGRRFVFVDVAAERLWLYENGQPVESMKVVVGSPQEATPALAALIRYVVFNPYWNVPPDIAQRSYAPRVRANIKTLTALRMDAWSGFTENASKLDPKAVDWSAAADGQSILWLRQRPGPTNAMGSAKFMLPNAYGIYLHDTPDRALFDRDQRALSAGCVRVENYRRLALWLQATDPGGDQSETERRVDLKAPVPVYLAYLTVVPVLGGVEVRRDFYDRDPAVLLNLRRGRQQISSAKTVATAPNAA